MKKRATAALAFIGFAALAAPPGGSRESFIQQQAYEAVQRVAGQVDVIEANQGALEARVRKLEGGGGEIAALKAEIEALKSELARLRRDMQSQREAIVGDITSRIDRETERQRQRDREQREREQRERERAAASQTTPSQGTYVVQSGDSLYLIAQAFGTTVGRIKEMNNLKSDMLQIGQRLKVPEKRR